MLAHAVGITICDGTLSPLHNVDEDILEGLTKDLVELRNLTGSDDLKNFQVKHNGREYKIVKQVFSSLECEIIYWVYCL